MGYATFSFLLILSFHLFVTGDSTATATATGDSDLIQQTCKTTKYYDLCISSLKSNPTSLNADTKGLAIIMIGIGAANATATSSYLQYFSTTTDAVKKKVLKECADKYSYASDALSASIQDLSDESYDYAYVRVIAAADYPNACCNAFKRYKGLAYPKELARREGVLKHILKNKKKNKFVECIFH